MAILRPGRIEAKPALLNIEMISRELAQLVDAQAAQHRRFIKQAAGGWTMRQEVADFFHCEGVPSGRWDHMERAKALEWIAFQVSPRRAPGKKGHEGIAFMPERLTTPPLARPLLDEAFDTRENMYAVSQGQEMQVGLPPGELRGTLLLVLGRPWTPPTPALQLSPGEVFCDHRPNGTGQCRTLLVRPGEDAAPNLGMLDVDLHNAGTSLARCQRGAYGRRPWGCPPYRAWTLVSFRACSCSACIRTV
jgi:hypothetical protein